MIKVKNLGELIYEVGASGNVTTGSKKTFIVPFACQLKAIFNRVRTAGTTGTQSTDVKKNGTSIFSGSARVDIATTATTATLGPMTTNPPVFNKGDIVEINIISVNTTPAVDYGFTIVLQRLKGTGSVGAVVNDSVGSEAE